MGDGPLLLTLEKLADELNITDRVLFMGNVTKSLVLPILSKSDLFVLNSTYEGLPHVVLEAMAVSVPVLATDVGGTGEVVLDGITGRLIPHGDEDALLIALKELLENRALAKTLTDKATKMIKEKFVFERMVNETEAVLKIVLLK
jgi:glycosyltransferase involved in cell wall biosynthesis